MPSVHDQAEDFAALLQALYRATANPWLQVVADLELSTTQLKALDLLTRARDRSVKDLALQLHLSLPAASRAVDHLVQRGLVERRECPHDRRSRILRLSPAGAEAVERITRARIAGIAAFLEPLPPHHREALHRAVAAILADFRATPAPASPDAAAAAAAPPAPTASLELRP